MKSSLFFALLASALTACQSLADDPQREATKLRMTEGKALFEEKCRTVAGEKIYRTVPEVEGVLLLKVRPARGDRELSDLMWPGAAFARESRADEFISTFLGYENATLIGYGGNDQLSGGADNDELWGGQADIGVADCGNDVIYDEGGYDFLKDNVRKDQAKGRGRQVAILNSDDLRSAA